MVSALFAEFLSHRMHEATVQAWSRPGLVTRLILLCFQVSCTPCPVMWPCTASLSSQVQRAHMLLLPCACLLKCCPAKSITLGIGAQCECVVQNCKVAGPGSDTCCFWLAVSHTLKIGMWLVSVAPLRHQLRTILASLQAVAITLNVGMCLLYMPLCHEVARLTSEAAARLWLYAAAELEAGQMPLLATIGVPELTQQFYGRGSGAAWAMRCIAADDIFIARFEGEMLCSTNCQSWSVWCIEGCGL